MKMITCKSLLLLAAIATTFTACGKLEMATPDTPTPDIPTTTPPVTGNNKIEGAWNFVGVKISNSTTVIQGSDKVQSYTSYTTENNKGICTIDGTDFNLTDLSYTINTTVRTVMYMDGELVTDMDFPFQVNADPYSAKCPYKLIGADSIFFSKGVMEMPSSGGGVVDLQPTGGKISWLGDTLVLTVNINQTTNGALVVAGEEMKFVKKP